MASAVSSLATHALFCYVTRPNYSAALLTRSNCTVVGANSFVGGYPGACQACSLNRGTNAQVPSLVIKAQMEVELVSHSRLSQRVWQAYASEERVDLNSALHHQLVLLQALRQGKKRRTDREEV